MHTMQFLFDFGCFFFNGEIIWFKVFIFILHPQLACLPRTVECNFHVNVRTHSDLPESSPNAPAASFEDCPKMN